MDDRAELDHLRKVKRLRELEAKARPIQEQQGDTLQVLNPFGKNFDTGINIGQDTSNYLAGAGKAFTDLGRRAGQLTGQVSEADIDESKMMDAPLMDTKAGMAGNITGNIASFLPTAAIPGANTVTGAGLVGAGMGLMQPVGKDDSTLKNVVLGAGTGAGAQFGLNKAASALANRAASKAGSAASSMTANSAKDATAREAKNAGFVLPRSETNPSVLSNTLERWAGKASVAQQASITNQQSRNAAAREFLGLAKDEPLTQAAFEPLKKVAWQAYDETRNLGNVIVNKEFKTALSDISKMSTKLNPSKQIGDLVERMEQRSFDSSEIVDAIRSFRGNAKTRLSAMNTDPVTRTLGKAETKAADALESLLESRLGGDALKNFKNARTILGKVGTIERMTLESSGDISSPKLVSAFQKGKLLSPELKVAAKFSERFPRFNQMNVNPIQGGGPLDVLAGAGGMGASLATGNPAPAISIASYAAGRPMARSLALSKMMSKEPSYSVGPISRLAPNVVGNEKLQAIARLLASGQSTK